MENKKKKHSTHIRVDSKTKKKLKEIKDGRSFDYMINKLIQGGIKK